MRDELSLFNSLAQVRIALGCCRANYHDTQTTRKSMESPV